MLWLVPDVQPRRRPTRAQVRAGLLDAAERLVRTRGFGVSVEEIATAAGMTKGAVYSNFASRAELLEAVADRVQPAPVDIEALAPEGMPVADAIEQGARALAARVDEHPEELVLLLDMVAAYARDPELLRRLREAPGPPGGWAADRLEKRAAQGGTPLPRDAAELAMVIDALALGLGATRLLRGPDAVPDDLFAWAFRRVVAPDQP